MRFQTFAFCFLLLFFSYSVSAQAIDFTHVISNSEDWRDVYSSIHYANLVGAGSDFLVSTKHGNLLIPSISSSGNIRIISSSERPYVLQYKNTLEDSGFTVEDEIFVENANLELIGDLPAINDFVIVGSTYGYSGIAVVPYAVAKRAWVFFADRRNIADIESILQDRQVNSILIYGPVDREVTAALESYNPEIIEEGDRFKDNIEIVEKYLELKPTNQVALTNGEFIEKGLMSGFDPILFTGKENVPDQIANYLKSSSFSVGVLVGSDLVGAATNIRRTTGVSVIVKFAQGARNPSGPIAAVEGLDLFYLTVPSLKLSIHSAKYNRATNQLEITYKSDSNVPVYFKGTITPIDSDGEGSRIGDVDPIFISPGDYKTVIYPDIELSGDELAAQIYTLYGDSPSALERILEQRVDISIINVLDKCEVDITKVIYSKPKDSFIVKVKNLESFDCWVDIELYDIFLDDDSVILGSEGATLIEAGKNGKVIIEQEMTDEDLLENSIVELNAYYGEREDSLVKLFNGKFNLDIQIVSLLIIIIIISLIIIIFLIILVWIKRRKDSSWGI